MKKGRKMIEDLLGVFIVLEVWAIMICGSARKWLVALYREDYSPKMRLKYRTRSLPFEDLEPAEGKEAIVEKRNKSVKKVRNILRLINVFIVLLTWLIKR